MARPKTMITEESAALAIAERESIKDWSVVHRLSAVVAYGSNTTEEVARVFGVTRETVIRWASHFHRDGAAGPREKIKGHRPEKLSPEQREIIRYYYRCR